MGDGRRHPHPSSRLASTAGLAIVLLAHAVPLRAEAALPAAFATYDEAAAALALEEALRGSERARTAGEPPAGCRADAAANEPGVSAAAYRCEFTETEPPLPDPSPAPGPSASPGPRRKAESAAAEEANDQITFYLDNDNLMLGAIQKVEALRRHDGDDRGLTHRMGLAYLRCLERNRAVSFEIASQIATKRSAPRWDDREAERLMLDGSAQGGYRVYDSEGRIPVNFLDVTRFRAAYAQGKDFYFKLGVGLELRRTSRDGGKLPPAAAVQNWWHETLGMYAYKYVPAEGAPVETGIDEKGFARETNGFAGDEGLEKVSRVGVLAEGAIGRNVRFFEGRCVLELEAGATIATEGRRLLGPNSHLAAGAAAKAALGRKRRDGSPRIDAELGGAIFYFPKAGAPGEPAFGNRSHFTIGSRHALGKRGKELRPFFTFWMPRGRQVFHSLSDEDAIQRIGLRFDF